jgi:Fur family zinc uptake transcriptional regulator
MDAAAAALGFAVERMNVEAVGLCPGCQERADGTD